MSHNNKSQDLSPIKSFPQHRWTLKFYGSLEDEFAKEYIAEGMRQFRVNARLTSIVVLAALWAINAAGLISAMGTGTNIAVSCGIVLMNEVGVSLASRKRFWKIFERLVPLGIITFHVAFAIGLTQLQTTDFSKFFPFFLVALLATTIANQVRWFFVALSTGSAMLGWLIFFTMYNALPQFGNAPAFLAGLTLVAWYFAISTLYKFEKAKRVQFILNKSLHAEQQASERLLFNAIPVRVAERLKQGDKVADFHGNVAVLFADIVGFTKISATLDAKTIVAMLDELFGSFDRNAGRFGVEKIKTIGDGYMSASGLDDAAQPCERLLNFALQMFQEIQRFNTAFNVDFNLRIGLHFGAVTAGVIGKSKFAYDIWGDTVNTASRMESTCPPGCIQVSQQFKEELTNNAAVTGPFVVNAKGKGEMSVFRIHPDTDFPSQK